MKKYCPNCGAQNDNDAKFCVKCGYRFQEQAPVNAPQPTTARSNHRNGWLIAIIVVLITVIVFIALHSIISNRTKSGRATHNTAESTLSSAGKNSPSTKNDSDKLTEGNHPKQDAASLIYYVAKTNISDSTIDPNGYVVRIPSDSDLIDNLSEKGQGQVYEVFRAERRNDGGPVFVYTIDSDNTINIYRESEDTGFDPDATYDPVKSISKSSVINYLNDHGMASDVKNLSNQIEIQQVDHD